MNEIRLLTTCKTNSKWIAELSIRILEENIGGKFLEAGLGDDTSRYHVKSLGYKSKSK